MATTPKPPHAQGTVTGGAKFTQAQGTTPQTLVSGGTEGVVVTAISAFSAATQAKGGTDLFGMLYLDDGSNSYLIGTPEYFQTATYYGTDKFRDCMDPNFIPHFKWRRELRVEPGWSLKVAISRAVVDENGELVVFTAMGFSL